MRFKAFRIHPDRITRRSSRCASHVASLIDVAELSPAGLDDGGFQLPPSSLGPGSFFRLKAIASRYNMH